MGADEAQRLLAMAEQTETRLRSQHDTETRARTLPEPIATTGAIYDVARELLRKHELASAGPRSRVRLTGVSASHLVPIDETRLLFPDEKHEKQKKLEAVSAALRDKFGGTQVTRATLLDPITRKRP